MANSFTFAKMYEAAHETYMQHCLQLAQLGAGYTAPNPMVGAVLVCDGVVIAEGYHQKYGEAHAEVNCIQEALRKHPQKIAFSTLYVSLEPCAHFGKTPPCVDLIIQHKIPKVVIACSDSFEQVNGAGIANLRAAGVDVKLGVLEQKAITLNRAFFTFHEMKRPYITLKWAQTGNGYISETGASRLMITNQYANRLVHCWRSNHAAIMVGANTALSDNPILDNRFWAGKPPQKIVFDPNLKVPLSARLFDSQSEVIILNTVKDAISKHVIYLRIDKNNILKDALQQLHQLNIQSIFVEGGAFLHRSFINENLWDEARIITNKELLVKSGTLAPVLQNQVKLKETDLLQNQIVYFKNSENRFIYADASLL